ncbi:hypothetical protein, partial [Burkholderia multivorans]
RGTIARATDGSHRSWRFTKLASSVAHVRFASAPNRVADATAAGLTGITQVVADDGSGKNLATYEI